MFESQLLAAFEIVTRGIKAPEQMLGSWAGAMGHTQFMPKSYIDFAVSANNGHPDIWAEDPADALVSTAHFLVCHGWKDGLPWGTPTDVPETENLTRPAPSSSSESHPLEVPWCFTTKSGCYGL